MKFKRDMRITRDKPDGSPGFVNVKAGHSPEEYGLREMEKAGRLDGLLVEASPYTIEDVIKNMLVDDPPQKKEELWTDKGKPRVEFIEQYTGQITEAQRDKAWKKLKPKEVR